MIVSSLTPRTATQEAVMGKPDEQTPRAVDAERACVLEGECRPRHASSKRTAQWCKGRVGIPHAWEWLTSDRIPNRPYSWERPERTNRAVEYQVCFGCEKQSWKSRTYCRLCGEPSAFTVTRIQRYAYTYRGASREAYHFFHYCVRCHAPNHVGQPVLADTEPWVSPLTYTLRPYTPDRPLA